MEQENPPVGSLLRYCVAKFSNLLASSGSPGITKVNSNPGKQFQTSATTIGTRYLLLLWKLSFSLDDFLIDGIPGHDGSYRTDCKYHRCIQGRSNAWPRNGSSLYCTISRTCHRRGRENSAGLQSHVAGRFHKHYQGQDPAHKERRVLENMYFHSFVGKSCSTAPSLLCHYSRNFVVSAFVTSQGMASLTIFLTNVTSVTLIGWKMASLHVQFHGTKVIPRPTAQVARISLRLLPAVLPRERLKCAWSKTICRISSNKRRSSSQSLWLDRVLRFPFFKPLT